MSKKFFCILVVSLSFFIANFTKANSRITINEIAWMGTEISSNDEWIELKNNSNETINLDNYLLLSEDGSINIQLAGKIPPASFFLLERTDDNSVPDVKADQIYVGSLGNDGEIITLYDSENNLLDSINANKTWPGGDNDTKQTLERKSNGSWQTSSKALGTPKSINSQKEISTPDNSITSNERPCYLGEILISEFIADPSEDKNEWIELYNTTYRDISLENWTLEDGSETKTTLSGNILKNNFLIIEKPKGKLNNNGDTIILRDQNQVIIDQVTYGTWDDGDKHDNAPATNNPNSIARKKENYNTRNNSFDFFITTTPTKNVPNLITPPKETKEKEPHTSNDNIIINEIFPNPIGTDYKNEFVEIYNQSTETIDLTDWIIKSSVNEYRLKNKIKAKSFLLIYRQDSGLVLKNNQESLSLLTRQNNTIQKIKLQNSPEGYSYNRNSEDNWSWEKEISPDKTNIIKKINTPPLVEFYAPQEAKIGTRVFFDSSDTYDADSQELKFLWDFGDGYQNTLANPEHTFFQAGNFLVSLKVSDTENTVQLEKKIKIISNPNSSFPNNPQNKNIIINELLPNPEEENNEWIEIYNRGETTINLQNWKLNDNTNKKPYYFPNFNLKEKHYKIFPRSETKIILNNDFDSLKLFDAYNNLLDEITYTNAPNKQSYARGLNGKWFWTKTPSPTQKNIISIKNKNTYDFLTSSSSLLELNDNSTNNLIPIEKIKTKKIGDEIITQGIVVALPNTLASQFFYINNEKAGVQVYNYKKDFPQLKLGDKIRVQGEPSQINEEWRIKTKTNQDIKIIETDNKIKAKYLSCGEINEDYLSTFISTAGEIIDKKSHNIFLDDGTGEINIYLKSNTRIDPKDYQEKDYIEIKGILSQTRTGTKLMPRFKEDIITKKTATSTENKTNFNKNEFELPARTAKNRMFKYFLTIISTIIIIIIIIKKQHNS